MMTYTAGITSTNCQFDNLDELMAATNPETGNYVIQLYGNIFIHQKPSVTNNSSIEKATLTAYQTDKQGRLHFIAEICAEPQINQLSVSADGRYFGFITNNWQLTTAYVYFMDTQDNSMDIAYSWSYKYTANSVLFFSVNGQFAVFSPCAEKMHVQPLYVPGPEVVLEAPAGIHLQSAFHNLVIAQCNDYMVWLQPTGQLAVIDMISGQQPAQWPETNIWLPVNYDSCVFYNNYLVYTHQPDKQSLSVITILGINNITRTVSVVKKFKFPEFGATWGVPDLDGKSVMLHNFHKHRETRMATLLPEITTHFHDYV
jgi:hypothetical protein